MDLFSHGIAEAPAFAHVNDPHDDPTDEQFAAIEAVDRWYADRRGPQVFFLAGGAGADKSITAKHIIRRLEEKRGLKRLVAGAYTGKAALVMQDKGIARAATIHSQIYRLRLDTDSDEVYFVARTDGPVADADLVLLDECSMIDDRIGTDLLMFNKKTLVLGDPFQLPPFCSRHSASLDPSRTNGAA